MEKIRYIHSTDSDPGDLSRLGRIYLRLYDWFHKTGKHTRGNGKIRIPGKEW